MCGTVPRWLVDRLQSAGGSVPFRIYMGWVLHDSEHGYYGSGRARIGPKGDFATSPSLGGEFADLLVPQLIEWLDQLQGERLSLVEAGPGEGQLIQQVVQSLAQQRPDLSTRTDLVLLEPNPGMVELQERRLKGSPLPVRWSSWEELHPSPIQGVVIAHEVLDALAVDRLLWDGQQWRWQEVALRENHLALVAGPSLDPYEWEALSLPLPSHWPLVPGWCTEIHSGLAPWFQACANAVREGILLVIDYAFEAKRYYTPARCQGTLMAYHNQKASTDPFLGPGSWDLTAHLCVEATQQAGAAAGWSLLGERRQGEALLALGLAQRFSALSQSPQANLSDLLYRREQLLRLVDPMATGEFRWMVFQRPAQHPFRPALESRCLLENPPFEAP